MPKVRGAIITTTLLLEQIVATYGKMTQTPGTWYTTDCGNLDTETGLASEREQYTYGGTRTGAIAFYYGST